MQTDESRVNRTIIKSNHIIPNYATYGLNLFYVTCGCPYLLLHVGFKMVNVETSNMEFRDSSFVVYKIVKSINVSIYLSPSIETL